MAVIRQYRQADDALKTENSGPDRPNGSTAGAALRHHACMSPPPDATGPLPAAEVCGQRRLGLLLACQLVLPEARATSGDLYDDRGPWLDDRGQPWRFESLRGRHCVLTLAYGACRRICSTSLRVLETVQRLADERGKDLDFVVIGLDPDEDKPADWAALRQDRHLKRSNWHFLWGDRAVSGAAAQWLGVKVWRIDSHLMHDYKIALIGPSGQVLRTVQRYGDPAATLLP
jgi:cytochrome oxidase Cu insertion factor (SCO1/SenC/PrrC family)